MINKYRGESYSIFTALLESLFPIISIYILVSIQPLFAYAFTIMIANIVFIAIITYKKTWKEFLIKEAWVDMLWLTFYITTLFILIMIGLQYTSAGNMSVIISLQLFFCTYISMSLVRKK